MHKGHNSAIALKYLPCHQVKARRTFSCLQLYRDEGAAPAAVQDTKVKPTTSSTGVATRPGWCRRSLKFNSASVTPTRDRSESPEWKTPLYVPMWQMQPKYLSPLYLYSRCYSQNICPNKGVYDTSDEKVRQQRPSCFRRAWKALRRAFCSSCISSQVEE